MWMCDFETNTGDIPETRVWAWAACEIGNESNIIVGNDISTFMLWVDSLANKETLYFHNLKFDGDFILNFLLSSGWKCFTTLKEATSKSIVPLISGTGAWYCLTLVFTKKRKIKIIDSLKILPFKVSEISKAFSLPESKLEIDYLTPRPAGHELTDDETAYVKNDVVIVAKALSLLFSQGHTKMTQGANALADYKLTVGGEKIFRALYPNIGDADGDIRQSYRGGFCYCNPKYKGLEIGEGIVLDVNSLYPSRMYNELLPYSHGVIFDGEPEPDDEYPLFVVHLSAVFRVRDGYLPTLQARRITMAYQSTEYLYSSDGDRMEMWLTSVDYWLFLDHYEVDDIVFYGGYKFRGKRGLFNEYIDKWMSVKIESTKNGNNGMRTLSKLMLNALYGKFGKNPKNTIVLGEIGLNGETHYSQYTEPDSDPVYIPMATFITAYARNYTIRAAQSVYDRFLYADTDSLHLLGTELPDQLEIDSTKLGAWDHELTFKRAKYIRSKCYIEEQSTGELKVTCAGLPHEMHDMVTWDNFEAGASYFGKKLPKHVKGGTVLIEKLFTIH